jgi:hypothetical protein
MIVVLIAPGPARSGTASGTTPDTSPDSSSSASSRVCRLSPTLAFNMASAMRSSTNPPPTWNAGRPPPSACSNRSPTMSAPVRTRNTVSVTTWMSRSREASSRSSRV